METVLHQDYRCAPDGHTTISFKAGDVLTGRAAVMALEDGAGFNPVKETKVTPALEKKRSRK